MRNSFKNLLIVTFSKVPLGKYYSKLKELYVPSKWNMMLEVILNTFEQQSYLSSTYLEIIKNEYMKEKILEYCKRNPSGIEGLYPYLIKDHFDEVTRIFKTYLERKASEASNRKEYKQVFKMIKTFKKACGDIPAHSLIHQLSQQYNKRPAFLDELRKLES